MPEPVQPHELLKSMHVAESFSHGASDAPFYWGTLPGLEMGILAELRLGTLPELGTRTLGELTDGDFARAGDGDLGRAVTIPPTGL